HSEAVAVIAVGHRQADIERAAEAIGARAGAVGPQHTPSPVPTAPPRPGRPDRNSGGAVSFTSGTTGRPKGSCPANRTCSYAGQCYANAGGLIALEAGRERMLTALPVYHMNAMAYSAMAMVARGGCLIALDRFHPGSWWQSVRESRASIVHYLGVMPPMLMS